MPGSLLLVQGPAGSGKSQLVREMIEAGELDAQLDFTATWASWRAVERDPETGKYPVRKLQELPDSFGILVVSALRREGRAMLKEGWRIAKTTAKKGQELLWQAYALAAGAEFAVRTVDVPVETAVERLAEPTGEDGRLELGPECENALSRWYGRAETIAAASEVLNNLNAEIDRQRGR